MVRDKERVGSGTESLEARNIWTEKGCDGYSMSDSNVDDVYRNRGGEGGNLCSCHVRVPKVGAFCEAFLFIYFRSSLLRP
jgi:hypothetical protein